MAGEIAGTAHTAELFAWWAEANHRRARADFDVSPTIRNNNPIARWQEHSEGKPIDCIPHGLDD